MSDTYPRLLADRDVVVIRAGLPDRAGHSRGELHLPVYRYGTGHVRGLVRLRRQLEPDGLIVAVQGARRDAYPSGMARDMGGGMQVYVIRPGLPGGQEDLVKTLDDAPPDQVATVDEQRTFFKAWLAENLGSSDKPTA